MAKFLLSTRVSPVTFTVIPVDLGEFAVVRVGAVCLGGIPLHCGMAGFTISLTGDDGPTQINDATVPVVTQSGLGLARSPAVVDCAARGG